jgi:hypothetical protein
LPTVGARLAFGSASDVPATAVVRCRFTVRPAPRMLGSLGYLPEAQG